MVKELIEDKKMEVLRFTATWCQPCKALAQQLEELGLDKDVTVADEKNYIEPDKKVFEKSFDDILKEA